MASSYPECKDDFREWKSPSAEKEHYYENIWEHGGHPSHPAQDLNEPFHWFHQVRTQYDSQERMLRVLVWHRTKARSGTSKTEQAFRTLVDHWRAETGHWSSVTRMLAHPSYLRIIGLATSATKDDLTALLLHELQEEPDYWFAALTAITGENPVEYNHDFEQSVEDWMQWGRQRGLI